MRDSPSWPAATSFFLRRWRGEVAMGVLFWRDLIVVGTMVNLYVGFAALLMVSQGVDARWALAVHLAPLPYNMFLLAAVWRCHRRSLPAMLAAAVWLVAVSMV